MTKLDNVTQFAKDAAREAMLDDEIDHDLDFLEAGLKDPRLGSPPEASWIALFNAEADANFEASFAELDAMSARRRARKRSAA